MNVQIQTEKATASGPDISLLPSAPRTLEETGLPLLFLVELVAKLLFLRGRLRLTELAQNLKLPATVLETVLNAMRVERVCEVARRGNTDGDIHYNLTDSGRARAAEFLQRNKYAGPAPASLESYTRQVQRQTIAGMRVRPSDVAAQFGGLVIKPHVTDQLGAAMNSGRAMFLFGPAGSGKTFLAEQMLRLLSGYVAVPYAICVNGEVIQVFDPLVHTPVEAAIPTDSLYRACQPDARWILCNRPVCHTGGELTLDMLDLYFDDATRFYEAPPHVKANNGLFVIDDLGRQLVSAEQLMNRWIVPMDRHKDYLALHTGYKFVIPFDVLLVFSTNLTPTEVADEAFLRRLAYKIYIGPLEPSDYRAIFQQVCQKQGVRYSEAAVEYLIRERHAKEGRHLLACYPRDLVGHICDMATYRDERPELTNDALDRAWRNYFASA